MISGRSSVALVVRLKSIDLPELGGAPARVRDRRLQHREIEQRLAAEEGEMRDAWPLSLQEELDAVARRLLGHELRLLAVLGVDDLVLAVLVAIGARQVALVRDVHHHRGERDDPGRGRSPSPRPASTAAPAGSGPRARARTRSREPPAGRRWHPGRSPRRTVRPARRSPLLRAVSARVSRRSTADVDSSSAKIAALGTRYRKSRPAAWNRWNSRGARAIIEPPPAVRR